MTTSPLDYLDFREFLRDWLVGRAGRPSLRGLAKRARLSPAMLSAVMGATRDLASDRAEVLADALSLAPTERQFFLLLVDYEQAPTRARRLAALDKIMASRRFRGAPQLADDAYQLLGSWFVPAVNELAVCEGFRDDPNWVARTLLPEVTRDEAVDALRILCALGLLERTADGALHPTAAPGDILRTHHEVAGVMSVAAGNLHRAMLARAAAAVDDISSDERHLTAATIAVPERLIPEIKEWINTFQEQAMSRCAAAGGPRERVVQLSVQLVPLTRRVTD